MRKIILSLLVCSLLIIGCDDSDNIINSSKSVDGLSLLGLVDGRTMVYIQTDTTITIDTSITPNSYTISISDTILSVLITGTNNDWIIHNGDEKLVNLKVGTSSIIQNGYWRKENSQDSLFYYASPPLLMARTLASELIWEYYTPFYNTGSAPKYLPFYYSNFGYKVIKEYIGIETIITPAGEFDSYRFDLQLFTTAFGDEPIAVITEYFVPNIGLVKQNFNIGVLRRSLILVSYTN